LLNFVDTICFSYYLQGGSIYPTNFPISLPLGMVKPVDITPSPL